VWLTQATCLASQGRFAEASQVLLQHLDGFGTRVAVAVLRDAAQDAQDATERCLLLAWLALRAEPEEAVQAAARAVEQAPAGLRAYVAAVAFVTGGAPCDPLQGDDPEGRLLRSWAALAVASGLDESVGALRAAEVATEGHPCARAAWVRDTTMQCASRAGLHRAVPGEGPAWVFAPEERTVLLGARLQFRRAKLQYNLLEAIALTPGTAPSALFEQVWQQPHRPPSSTNTLHVTVKRLRERLSRPITLRSIAGGGYALQPQPEVYLWGQPSSPAPDVPHPCPVPMDRFIGRTQEQARIRELLEHHRVVTLTGPGGIGKTRLAMELARSAGCPVWFVSLAGAHTVADVLRAIRPGLPEVERGLAGVLPSHGWVILDNAEQVLDPLAALVGRWEASGVSLLVTSREALRVDGEAVVRLDALTAQSAQALLLARCNAEANEALAGLASSAGGLPLALEMVAARLSSLSIEEVAVGLERHRLDLLASGRRGAPLRHRTMRANLDASWALLKEEEAELLAAASTFADTFSAEDVATLLGRRRAAVDVYGLCDKSLIGCTQGGLRVSQIVREYAVERVGSERWAQLLQLHAAWALGRPDRNSELRALVHRDLRPTIRGKALLALANWLHYQALPSEIGALVAPVLRALPPHELNLRCQLHLLVGHALAELLDPSAAAPHLDAGLVLATQADDPRLRAIASYFRANLHMLTSESELAAEWAGRCLELANALQDHGQAAGILNNVAGVLETVGSPIAIQAYAAAAARMGAAHSPNRPIVLLNLGTALLRKGLGERARTVLVEAVAAAERAPHAGARASCDQLTGHVELMTGSLELASAAYRRAWQAHEAAGHRFGAHNSRLHLAGALLHLGRDVAAEAAWNQDEGVPEGALGAQLRIHRLVLESQAALAQGSLQRASALLERLQAVTGGPMASLEGGRGSGVHAREAHRLRGIAALLRRDLPSAAMSSFRVGLGQNPGCQEAQTAAWLALAQAAAGRDPQQSIAKARMLLPAEPGWVLEPPVTLITEAAVALAAGERPRPPTGSTPAERLLRRVLSVL
jgi:hypothetical protein